MIELKSTRIAKIQRLPGIAFEAKGLNFSCLPRVDSHLHTAWTDGQGTVREVHDAAIAKGLTAIVFSEHSRKTSIDWFSKFASEVRSLPQDLCRTYVGTECKVESAFGSIDTCPDISDLCDFITVSVHRFPDKNGQAIEFASVSPDNAVDIEFHLTWSALENPGMDILGHMFGMSISRYKVNPPDEKFQALIRRAADLGVIVEINTRYHREPLKLLTWCAEFGAYTTFGSDAHILSRVGENVEILTNVR